MQFWKVGHYRKKIGLSRRSKKTLGRVPSFYFFLQIILLKLSDQIFMNFCKEKSVKKNTYLKMLKIFQKSHVFWRKSTVLSNTAMKFRLMSYLEQLRFEKERFKYFLFNH